MGHETLLTPLNTGSHEKVQGNLAGAAGNVSWSEEQGNSDYSRDKNQESAANMDGAEADDHMAASGWPAEAEHRTEAREDQNLIEVMAGFRRSVAVDDVVRGHLPVRIHRHVHQKVVLKFQIRMLHLRHGRHRIIGKRDEFGGLQQAGGNIIRIGLDGNARRDQVKNENKNDQSREKAASGRDG